jgi:drug/metabolite transporter (DMT)-like permease
VGWRGWTVFAALGLIWGLPYFFIKLAVQEVAPLLLAFCRVALAAAVLLPIAWRRGSLRGLGSHKTAIVAFALWVLHEPLGIGGGIAFGTILLGSWLATLPTLTLAIK